MQQALATGNWDRAQELGATDTQIINAGGVYMGTTTVQEGPEQYQKTVWGGGPTGTITPSGSDSITVGGGTFSTSDLEERTSWDEGYDDFSVDEYLATDTTGGFDDYYVDDSFDWKITTTQQLILTQIVGLMMLVTVLVTKVVSSVKREVAM